MYVHIYAESDIGDSMRICPAAGVATLTTELAQGKNMPRQNSPSNGPPTMPKMLMAALEEGEKRRGLIWGFSHENLPSAESDHWSI